MVQTISRTPQYRDEPAATAADEGERVGDSPVDIRPKRVISIVIRPVGRPRDSRRGATVINRDMNAGRRKVWFVGHELRGEIRSDGSLPNVRVLVLDRDEHDVLIKESHQGIELLAVERVDRAFEQTRDIHETRDQLVKGNFFVAGGHSLLHRLVPTKAEKLRGMSGGLRSGSPQLQEEPSVRKTNTEIEDIDVCKEGEMP